MSTPMDQNLLGGPPPTYLPDDPAPREQLAEGVDPFDFLNRLKVVVLSSNLGDNRTLAIPVAHTIFYEMGGERRAAMDIADSLIRISVGIEDGADLIADFRQALG